MKITTIGPYGFKVDDGDVWFSCDKYFLNSSLFKSLKVGNEIKDIKNNKNGFVKSLIVLTHKDQGEEVIKSQITSLNVCSRNINSVSNPSLPAYTHKKVEGVLEREEVEVAKHLNPQVENVNSRTSSVQDSINFSLALKIAFNSVNIGGFKDDDTAFDFAFERAEKIYDRLTKRCSR
jgi:hypothetical protein